MPAATVTCSNVPSPSATGNDVDLIAEEYGGGERGAGMPKDPYNYRRFDEYVEHGSESEEFAAFADGLHVGQPAPGFPVTRLDDGERFDIADLWQREDVVMEFGSFT